MTHGELLLHYSGPQQSMKTIFIDLPVTSSALPITRKFFSSSKSRFTTIHASSEHGRTQHFLRAPRSKQPQMPSLAKGFATRLVPTLTRPARLSLSRHTASLTSQHKHSIQHVHIAGLVPATPALAMSSAAISATVPAVPTASSDGVPPSSDYSPRYIDVSGRCAHNLVLDSL